MINLDDDDDIPIQPIISSTNINTNTNQNSKANLTNNNIKNKGNTVAKKRVAPFEIMVP